MWWWLFWMFCYPASYCSFGLPDVGLVAHWAGDLVLIQNISPFIHIMSILIQHSSILIAHISVLIQHISTSIGHISFSISNISVAI
jgi:hypothetical protein